MPTLDGLLIGNGSLLASCGDALRAAGVRIVGVVSEDPTIQRWAAGHGLPVEPFASGIADRLGAGAVDYVFSIGNLRVLPPDWLALARRHVINFHDALLPRYAGLHATTWALIHREPSHGITWHVAVADVDRGGILEQETFAIAADETALTLNAKCYEAGHRAFQRLVAALVAGTLEPRPMPEAGRHYFGRRARPAAAGHLDWSQPLDELDALVRALDFGPYANPLCTPWFLEDGAVARADAATIARARAGDRPGAEPLPAGVAARITAQHRAWCVDEPAWIARLRALRPLALGSRGDAPSPASEVRIAFGDLARHGAATLAAAWLAWCVRAFDQTAFDVGCRGVGLAAALEGLERWFETLPPLRVTVDPARPFVEVTRELAAAIGAHDRAGSFLRDLGRRTPDLRAAADDDLTGRLAVGLVIDDGRTGWHDDRLALRLAVSADGARATWRGDPRRLPADLDTLCRRAETFLRAAFAAPETAVGDIPVVSANERHQLLVDWNRSERPGAGAASVVEQFEAQVARTPHHPALSTWRETRDFAAVNRGANRLARRLMARGIGRGDLVGLHVDRSADMVVAVLGILKAGAAYLPLDPSYPAERTATTLADAGAAAVITTARHAAALPADVSRLDLDDDHTGDPDEGNPAVERSGADLAYVIYTSGSTGGPKGVMLEHGNVTSFFAAMDARLDPGPPGVWLAVTSLSFDISVLELLWTLCRGFHVVLHTDPRAALGAGAAAPEGPIDLSLFYFASDESAGGAERYRLLTEGAVFADQHGFEAVWTPERHFHAFGGLYPNPAITSAAVAALTRRVGIRAGSLVLPLHHPVRAAEDWALVDNLSNGRVGIAFASGWHPNDFVLAPDNHARAKQVMFDGLATMRRLWRGESVVLPAPGGRQVEVRTLPRPVQPELPCWITTAGNPETFAQAGALGANVLTHLLGQTVEEVAEKLRVYRTARREAGHAGPGHVTLMLHTFVGDDDDQVRAIVREPMKQYLGSSLNLVKQHAWSFPAFKGRTLRPDASTDDLFRDLSPADLDALLEHAFERYFRHGGLFGSIDTCVATIERLRAIGVDEIACLIDFGVPAAQVLASLAPLAAVRARVAGPRAAAEPPLAALIERFAVTHFQCTPSLAAMLVDHPASVPALGRLRHWLVGGEALPEALLGRIRQATTARVTNMYGPTETTVWSLTHDLTGDETPVPIGTPIAGTRVYVLDPRGQLVPPGAPGELYLGGPGVARGYHRRPDLTAARFLPDPFAGPPARMYRTGDRVRFRPDGVLEFLGRMDHQVKLRGHRIELGEIEEALGAVPGVREAAVALHGDGPTTHRLIGYVSAAAGAALSAERCREAVKARLPEVMVPAVVVVLEALPRTPNGKIDRRALPSPDAVVARPAAPPAAPGDDGQRRLAAIWRDVLALPAVGIDDNFFELGGHSLLTMQVAGRIGEEFGRTLPITDLFRFPTIRTLARHLAGGSAAGAAARVGDDRAAARRAARPPRRGGPR